MFEAGTIVTYAPRKRGVVIDTPAINPDQVLIVGNRNDHEFPVDRTNLQPRGTYDTTVSDPNLCGGFGETGCRYLGTMASTGSAIGFACLRFSPARDNRNRLLPTNHKRRPSRPFPLCQDDVNGQGIQDEFDFDINLDGTSEQAKAS